MTVAGRQVQLLRLSQKVTDAATKEAFQKLEEKLLEMERRLVDVERRLSEGSL